MCVAFAVYMSSITLVPRKHAARHFVHMSKANLRCVCDLLGVWFGLSGAKLNEPSKAAANKLGCGLVIHNLRIEFTPQLMEATHVVNGSEVRVLIRN